LKIGDKPAQFEFFLGIMKVGAAHSEEVTLVSNPICSNFGIENGLP
jgi:hypothetical protein